MSRIQNVLQCTKNKFILAAPLLGMLIFFFLKEVGRECFGELVYRTINIFAKIIELSVSFQIASGPWRER